MPKDAGLRIGTSGCRAWLHLLSLVLLGYLLQLAWVLVLALLLLMPL